MVTSMPLLSSSYGGWIDLSAPMPKAKVFEISCFPQDREQSLANEKEPFQAHKHLPTAHRYHSRHHV